VLNYASWITPGLFGGGFQDITALSHEMSETFNDPFVNNATPWWLSPSGQCQNNLEDGDVIEGLPNPTFPIKLNGVTWHPKNGSTVAVVCRGNAVAGDSWRLQLSRHHRADNGERFAESELHATTLNQRLSLDCSTGRAGKIPRLFLFAGARALTGM
jgi:hypothetical protein